MNTNPEDAKLKLVAEYADLWGQAAEAASATSENEHLKAGITEADFLLKQIQFGFRVKSPRDLGVRVSPFDPRQEENRSAQHLYLKGLLEIAEIMATTKRGRGQLLLLGELREELGTFRTSIANSISANFFEGVRRKSKPSALTADIGLRVRLTRPAGASDPALDVLCTTCDLDNDLIPSEKFHAPSEIREVCVKGEDEGVFYNCWLHDPRMRDEYLWVESVERYDVFGE